MSKKQKSQSENGAADYEPIAIVGLACMFPKAGDAEAYWANIKNGVDAIDDIPKTHWSPEDYFDGDPKAPDMTYAKRGGFLDPVDFDPLEFGIAPKDIEATDTTQILGLVAAKKALADAGYSGEGSREFDRNRTSVILGVTGTLELVIPLGARLGHPIWKRALDEAGVDPETADDVVQRISDSYVPWQENSFPGLLGNVAAGRIANRLDLGGTNCVVDAACASSLSAVHLAGLELNAGRSDMVVTGGVDTFNDIFMYMCFSKTPALSKSGNAKPFSADADGTILGEGVGMVVLKRLSDAERDHDKIYAVIRGLGSSSDGAGDAVYAPQSSGQKKAIKRAYEQAGVTPDTIEMVEAHGTGTTVGDSVEVNALKDVYCETGENGSWCALGSVKSQIGHTKAAAGAAGLIKAALALHHKTLPPTIKVTEPVAAATPETTPLYVNAGKRPWIADESHPRRAGVSSFGFGGSNFHCLLEEYGDNETQTDWDGSVQLLAFSADKVDDLRKALAAQKTDLPWAEFRSVAAQTRREFDGAKAFRLILIVERDRTDFAKLLTRCQSMLEQESTDAHWELPEGAVFGSGEPTGDLGVLFPGQGSQYPDMLRDLACEFPEMQATLAQANRIFAEERNADRRLSDFIYPHAAFDKATSDRQRDELTATDVAQPAIGAVSLGSLKILESFDVKPAAAAGHSYGELVALCASGVFESTTLHRLSNLRGRLMAEAKGDGKADSGAMLAVKAPGEEVEEFIKESELELVVANRNAPDQSVLAGAAVEIDRAAGLLEEKSVWNRKLPVAAAFHSPLVAAAQKPFEQALAKVKFSKAGIPVYANTTAESYPKTAAKARKLLGGQLAQPVDFVSEIKTMREAGVSTFLEIGPGRTLTGLVKSILDGDDVRAIALDNSRGKRSGAFDLANVLGNLAALGHDVDLTRWDEGAPEIKKAEGKKPRLTIPVSGANQMNERPKRPPRPAQPKPAPAQSTQPAATSKPTPTPQIPAATPAPIPSQPAEMKQALQDTRQSLAALIQLQEQTARLHKQFLEGQEAAQRTLHALIAGQGETVAQPTANQTAPTATPVPSTQTAPTGAPGIALPEPASAANAEQCSALQSETCAPPPTAKPDASEQIGAALLEVVAEKTGYPTEMLNLDMGLDSDLGIDSIKRVEIMSALQEKLTDAPEIKPSHLGSFETLQEVVDFLNDGSSYGAPSIARQEAPAAPAPESASTLATTTVATALLEVVAEKTGYPTEMLNLDMGLDSDLGIDSIKRVEIMSALQERLPEAPEVKPSDLGSLETLQQVVDFLCQARGAGAPSIARQESSPAPTSGLSPEKVSQALLEVVAEKTGYPVDMLGLEMGMDTDLGIDSIKRVEIMSALQTALPEAPEVKPNDLGALQTLQEVVDFLCQAGDNGAPGIARTESPSASAANLSPDKVSLALLAVVAEKTGYPVDMLGLEMGMDTDLGIDSIKRVEIMSALQSALPEAPEVKPNDLGALQTLQEVVDFLCQAGDAGAPSIARPESPSASAANLSPDKVSQALLTVVAEKTGYPVEMLGLEMGMDTDLGIDSIKRVEIMSALQTALPEAPEVKPNDLGALQTLQEVVDFLCLADDAGAPGIARPEPAAAQAEVQAIEAAPAANQHLDRQVLTPVELNGHHKQEAISLNAGATIWIADDGSDLAKELEKKLKRAKFAPKRETVEALLAKDAPKSLNALIIVGPENDTSGGFLNAAFRLIQFAGPALRKSGANGGSALVTVSRLDGAFGLAELNGNGNPVTGGLAGLTKTARHEWSEVHCKALDIDAESGNAKIAAKAIIDEMFREGPVEVGLAGKTRNAIELQSTSIDSLGGAKPLEAGDVVIVSGGSRGVTASTAIALAEVFHPTLVLLGRSDAPQAEPGWLAGIEKESEIKKVIHGHLNGSSGLKEVEREYRRWMSNREMNANIAKMEAAGAKVVYRSVDVRDGAAVQSVVETARKELGPIRGVVHGAGVLADRRIEDKTAEQFDLVYSTKVNGLQAMLEATKQDDLKVVALFSSFTGRYGRVGQIDYAVANEVLNKLAQSEARRRPDCRVVSVNWGPWNGGMVDASLRRVFEAEGVGLIEPRAGAEYLVKELSTPAGEQQPVEVVVLAPFGDGETNGARNSFRFNAGNDRRPKTASPAPKPTPASAAAGESIAVERSVSVANTPCLKSHVIGGKAVLPLALSTELLAHGALHGHPGMAFIGIDNLKVFKGVMLDADEAQTLQVVTKEARQEDRQTIVPAQLISHRDGKRVAHAGGDIVLAAKLPKADKPSTAPDLAADSRERDEIYAGDQLFHGLDFQGIQRLEGCDENGIAAQVECAPSPKNWIADPLRGTWITDPLALDCAYQMLILWSWQQNDKPSLPTAAASYRQFKRKFPKDGVRIVAKVTDAKRRQAKADIEFIDSKGALIARMEGYRCVIDDSLKEAFGGNELG